MSGAIEALFETPRNQLKIFRGMHRISVDQLESQLLLKKYLCDFIVHSPLFKDLANLQHHLSQFYGEYLSKFKAVPLDTYLDALTTLLDSEHITEPLMLFLMSISLEDCSFMVLSDSDKTQEPRIKLLDLDIKLANKVWFYVSEHDLGRRVFHKAL